MIGLKDVIDSFGEAACLWAEAVGTTPLWDQFLEAIETIRNS